LLGFAASEGKLENEEFVLGMLGLQFEGARPFHRPDWMEAVTKSRLISLAEWIGAKEWMPDEEKLWWIWQLGRHSESKAHLGKALLEYWLGRPDVSPEAKVELCRSWLLDEQEAGRAPLIWLLSDAFLAGDQERFRQLMEDADIDPELLPSPFEDEAIEETFDFPFDTRMAFRDFVFMAPTLKRAAIPGLVRYSDEGFEEIANKLWDQTGSYYTDAINSGIADALEEFQESIQPERIRFWVERGINHGRAGTRKRFYALSIEFYGTEYLERALSDNAKSVRTWAGKKLRALRSG
jgi:hypothetical protein